MLNCIFSRCACCCGGDGDANSGTKNDICDSYQQSQGDMIAMLVQCWLVCNKLKQKDCDILPVMQAREPEVQYKSLEQLMTLNVEIGYKVRRNNEMITFECMAEKSLSLCGS